MFKKNNDKRNLQSDLGFGSMVAGEVVFGARFGNLYEGFHGTGHITVDIGKLSKIE